jgi:hypothetical protein
MKNIAYFVIGICLGSISAVAMATQQCIQEQTASAH